MSLRDTSTAVNEAVEAVRAQIAYLRAQMATRPLLPDEVTQLKELTDTLGGVENNRAGWVVAAIAGRRGLDKIPVGEMDYLVRALIEDSPPAAAPVPLPEPPAKKRRK